MRKLYCVPECEPCQEIKDWIKEQKIEVDITELKKIDNNWHEQNEDGYKEFDKNIKSFPALLVGMQDNNRVFVVGKEGIQSLLKKNYIYETKTCPYFNGPCLEKECGKFVIMTKGPFQEGNCSDYWTPILLTEMLTKGK